MRLDIPFSAATERNKFVISEILKKHLSEIRSVLEIGSGTGQHCIYFARQFPHLLWQPSDLTENLSTIALRIEEYPAENLLPPIELEIGRHQIPFGAYQAIYTSNTLHIWDNSVTAVFFGSVGQGLEKGGLLIIYGPFHYNGKPTSEGNAIFDRNLKRMDPSSGIKDMDQIIQYASRNNLVLLEDYEMPVNNRCLVFSKI